MRKAGVRVLLSCLSFAVLSACGGSPQPERGTDLPTTDLEVVSPDDPPLPETSGVLKFAVVGDSGRWSQEQRELARQLAAQHERFPFDFVLMLGDNNYGDGSPQSFKVRFEEPYQPLLEAGVKFYATLGNHDEEIGEQWKYPQFNMGGQRYLTFEKKTGLLPPVAGTSVRFFVLNTNHLDTQQVAWLTEQTRASQADWKIAYAHHPLFSTGRYASANAARRRVLEPIYVRNGVDVVFAGHEHFYERLAPQSGVVYFVAGGSGSVRRGEMSTSDLVARGYDQDLSFMLVAIGGDTMYFQTLNRLGETVDSGHITKKRRTN
jgi:3',5'-cyclic AMP phosphodiesterase CpdA